MPLCEAQGKYLLVLFLTGVLEVSLEHRENTIHFQRDFLKHKMNLGISEMSHQRSEHS